MELAVEVIAQRLVLAILFFGERWNLLSALYFHIIDNIAQVMRFFFDYFCNFSEQVVWRQVVFELLEWLQFFRRVLGPYSRVLLGAPFDAHGVNP